MFFSRQEDFAILAAATERIFPKDETGPGAIELEVPYFIDKQLAGYWGLNGKSYMKSPFYLNLQTHEYQHKNPDQDKSGPNTDTQAPTPIPRHQSRLNRGEIFMQGIRRIDEVSRKRHDKKFVDLEGTEQDEILQAFESGEVKMNGVASVTFFSLLKQTTIEGAYADPVYGGNKHMLGWKMKEYPGPRMGYTNEIEEESFIKKKQLSLRDYQS
ncbi:Gluconate 2-dehydrogenase (acceptor) [Lentibacillus sp. JNUCC-1]|uniref:gluconate 2-dehydrogenase subunit 3 family protein n=1 Tax=Lentibacillus sp. JNUCC-1 TaxID=2654513 RepID=UPI001326B221|nr:Gluconate 2-dehydrogenase (acceptor) [Lentibacillus sp. JNUCC-1]